VLQIPRLLDRALFETRGRIEGLEVDERHSSGAQRALQ